MSEDLPYRVRINRVTAARFRTERAARDWAMTLDACEIVMGVTLIGQYRFGQVSEEFRAHHEACYAPIRGRS